MDRVADSLIAQVDDLLREMEALRNRAQYEDLSDIPERETVRFVTRGWACIERVAGDQSPYSRQCADIRSAGGYPGYQARQVAGVLDSLRADLAAGYLATQRELIHGELFADFLEMAGHLLGEGYKDPAAVVAGASLEAHLRQLCSKFEVDAQVISGDRAAPKRADRLNSDLKAAGAYSQLDQKSVTAWLDLRNKAAHGRFEEYEAGQVDLMISGIRDFITRNPA